MTEEDAEQMRLHGAPEVEIEEARRADVFLLEPANLPAVQLLSTTLTQWRWISGAAGARRVGLDYAAVAAAAKADGVKLSRQLFRDLQVCEVEALKYWRESAA